MGLLRLERTEGSIKTYSHRLVLENPLRNT